jgi:hypothetical protein
VVFVTNVESALSFCFRVLSDAASAEGVAKSEHSAVRYCARCCYQYQKMLAKKACVVNKNGFGWLCCFAGAGGFNGSPQHLEEGSCDEGKQAEFGSIRSVAAVVTWASIGCGTR